MIRIKKFLSLSILIFCGLVGVLLPTRFSVAQNYGPTEDDLKGKSFRFLMPNNPLHLYAILAPNTYTIHFDGNESTSWSMAVMNMTYGQSAYLLLNNFTKDWYTFKWWSRTITWEVEFLDQQEVENLSIVDWWNVILYAQRQGAVPYTVEYYLENLDGAYDRVWSDVMYWIEGSQVPPTSVAYTWFTLQTGAEDSVTSGWIVQYRYTRNTYNLTVKDRDKVLINTWVKYWADIVLPVDNPTWTWNVFSWWDNLPADGKMPANNIVITSSWNYGVHTITFNTNWWTEVPPITGNYGDEVQAPIIPTREWYEFVWWSPDLPEVMPYDDVVVIAIWREITKDKSSWPSWRWRSEWSSNESEWKNQHGAAIDQVSTRPNTEVLVAYMWAHSRWIIDVSRANSDPDGYIPRWDMAEMVVRFTENVLERKIPTVIPAKCHWWDAEREWKSPETKIYAEKACALWVMWIRMEDFMPNKLVDRAEFWTILSRLLRWDKYDVVDATLTNPYYAKHLAALNREWIMNQIDNPKGRNELRKWARLMLMRVKF